MEARDKDRDNVWRFVSGLTKQEKLLDSEDSNTSKEVIELKDSYRNVYVDPLIKSPRTSNKNIITRVNFNAPTLRTRSGAEIPLGRSFRAELLQCLSLPE